MPRATPSTPPSTPPATRSRRRRSDRVDLLDTLEIDRLPLTPPSSEDRPVRRPRSVRSKLDQEDEYDAKPSPPSPPRSTAVVDVKQVNAKRRRVTSTAKSVAVNGDRAEKPLLIQERVRHDTWKMLVATSLLNVTSGRNAIPLFWKLLERWPDAQSLSQADESEVEQLIRPLGLSRIRSARLILFSEQYLASPFAHPSPIIADAEEVRKFAGAGQYAVDSFMIYSALLEGGGAPKEERRWIEDGVIRKERCHAICNDAWRQCRPRDKELIRYLQWRWGLEGVIYDPVEGPLTGQLQTWTLESSYFGKKDD